jgi:hypothetical protein
MERRADHPAGAVEMNGALVRVSDESAAPAPDHADVQGSLGHGGDPFSKPGEDDAKWKEQ